MEKNPRAEMLDFEKIGDRLRNLRKQKGITLVPSDKVDMLVKYYDVTADYILYGDESYKFLK